MNRKQNGIHHLPGALWNLAEQLIYPARCALCDEILTGREKYLCGTCREQVPFLKEPVCCRCGRPMTDDTKEYCPHCSRTEHLFEQGFAPFAYDGPVREALIRLKYGHRAEYAAFFARAMQVFGGEMIRAWKPQALIPVPVYKDRLITRGYNQAELLAEALSKKTGIPVRTHCIRRIRGTLPQKELGPGGRRRNLRGAFCLDQAYPVPERILLVDDIYTTGSTVDAVSAHLLRGGAKQIWFACASVAPGG